MIPFAELAATSVPPADRRETYGSDALQFGELRMPAKSGKHPVIVLIHGGCWRSAYTLAHVGPAAAALARAGYVVWVPEYRRVGDAGGGWPGTFEDIAAAVDYVRTLATRFSAIDSSRVILVGHSAGGQLALWAASRSRRGTAAGLDVPSRPPLAVSGVVSLAGITDMAAYGAATGGCNSAVAALMDGTPADMPQRYRAVNPIDRLPLGVPVYLVHGAADPIVPVALSEQYATRARAAGDRVEISRVERAGHFDVVAPQATAWAAVVAAIHAIAAP